MPSYVRHDSIVRASFMKTVFTGIRVREDATYSSELIVSSRVAQVVTFLTCIWEVSISYLDLNINCPEWGSSWFSSVCSGKCGIVL